MLINNLEYIMEWLLFFSLIIVDANGVPETATNNTVILQTVTDCKAVGNNQAAMYRASSSIKVIWSCTEIRKPK